MLEGLAGQAASTGRRTGSCCCRCCRSAISVGEARWSGPLELPQCLLTAPLHCPSASRQLLYTVCRCLQTAPLHCLPVPPDSSATLSQCLLTAPLHCLLVGCDSSTSSFARKRQLCRGAGWGVEGSRLEALMKSHKSEVAITDITFICTPTRKRCRLSPESDGIGSSSELLLTLDLLVQGHWGKEDAAVVKCCLMSSDVS